MSKIPNVIIADTSDDTLKIAASINGKSFFLDKKNNLRHIENLIPEIDNVLKEIGEDKKSLEYAGICEGPGSFTGIRIGIAAFYGLAFGNNVKCFGFSAFEVYRYLLRDSENIIIPLIDAKKNKFYCSFISPKVLKPIEMFDLSSEEILQKTPSEAIFVGKDCRLLKGESDYNFSYKYEDGFSSRDAFNFSLDLILSGNELRFPEPIYLRKSEAELSLLRGR